MKVFCDLTNQQFATSLRDRSEPRIYFTEDNEQAAEFYLVRPTFDNRWPFSADPLSGSESLESPVVTLFNPVTNAPLTVPALLTPIRKGFAAVIDLATLEVNAFLKSSPAPVPERQAILSIDAVLDTRPCTLFRAALWLRPSAAGGAPTSSFELSGAGDPITLTEAGMTDLAPAADFIQWFQLLSVTPDAGASFTRQITLDSARARPGARFTVHVVIPAAAHPPIIQIFDNSVSSALLDTINGDTDNDTTYRFDAVLVGTGWQKEEGQYLDA